MNEMLNVLPGKSSSTQGGRVHPDLEALLALQDRDVALASCDARLKALDPELKALDDQIHAAERGVEQARADSGGAGPARRARREDPELPHDAGAAPPETRVGARGQGSLDADGRARFGAHGAGERRSRVH